MQMPSSFINLILLISIFVYLIIFKNKKNISFFLMGSIFSVLIFLVFLYLTKISIKSLIEQYLLFPLTIGESRITSSEEAWPAAKLSNRLTFRGVINHFKFIHLFVFGFIFLIIKSFILEKNQTALKNIFLNIVIILSSFSFIFHQLITGNQTFIFSLIPILGGLFYLEVNENFKNKKVIKTLILIIVIFATTKYHQEYNVKRKFMDLQNVDLSKSIDGVILDRKFKGLNWISPLYPEKPSEEIALLKETLQVLKNDERNKMVITHYQFFSFILEKYLNNPNRWYYLGNNTFPSSTDNKYFTNYKRYFSNMIDKKSIETIYIIQSESKELNIEIFKKYLNNKCFKNKRINQITIAHTLENCS
jgi:hypothetical protein